MVDNDDTVWESLLLVEPFYFFINDPIVPKLGQGTNLNLKHNLFSFFRNSQPKLI